MKREYPERPIVGVGAVIVIGGHIVLIRRRHAPLAGHWSLPGGSVELGETLEAAVVREIREETGLDVEVGPVIEVFDRIMRDEAERVQFHFVLIDYLCWPAGGVLAAGSDVDRAELVDAAHLAPFHLTPKATAVIQRAVEMDRSAPRPARR